jgi:hypothetical protein
MAPLPRSVIADGAVKVAWVPAIADPNSPKLTELSAVSAIDLSCYLTAFTPGSTTSTITDDRLCSKQVFSRVGSHTDTLTWTYIYQPQAKGTTPAVTDNAAQDSLVPLAEGFVVMRWGQDAGDPFAIGDVVDVYPAQCDQQVKQPPARNETLKISQDMQITGPAVKDRLVVA